MGSVLDLPLKRQKEIAKMFGYESVEKWREDTKKQFEEDEKDLAEMEAYKPTKAEIEKKINSLLTNPFAIEYYRRMTMNDDLTVEKQIEHLRSLETID